MVLKLISFQPGVGNIYRTGLTHPHSILNYENQVIFQLGARNWAKKNCIFIIENAYLRQKIEYLLEMTWEIIEYLPILSK